ncbi:MAG: hypothetical protein U9N61_00235 [Euryarchaeota archaeon]|nr:hypothetical protein [Euryarchaeota archaeon]
MIKIEPYDDLDDTDPRWNILGYGLVFERDLIEYLRLYARYLSDDAEMAGEGGE